ncbi:MAG: tetraacyldisaccharide 4'-kinase [Terracidiphilus sp.]|jgi:tetraacyldisaccharide 4'-kinase
MSRPFSSRKLLAPLTPAYRLAVWLRAMRLKAGFEPVRHLRSPVVSIGNLSTGGTGKTPLTIALAQALKKRGFHVDVLSRGYGREGKGAARVDPGGSAEQFGDEPLLIAREAGVPVYVARQRYEAGVLAEADRRASHADGSAKPAVHLLDDGFQHSQLARDVDVVLLNREDWQGRLLPAGNLREPLKAIHRADIVALPAEDAALVDELRRSRYEGTIWRLRRTMEIPPLDGPALAFCGIARPEQFFTGLKAGGARLSACKAFPDHHRFSERDARQLIAEAKATGAAALFTTEKDLVRMGRFAEHFANDLPMQAVSLRIAIEQEDEKLDAVIHRLMSASAKPSL